MFSGDYLAHLIYLPKLYYSNSFVKICTGLTMAIAALYLYLLLYKVFYNKSESISDVDMLISAAIVEVRIKKKGYSKRHLHLFQMVISKVCLDYEWKTIKELKQTRIKYFWTNKFVTFRQRRILSTIVKYFTGLHIVLWCCVIIVTAVSNTVLNVYPQFFFYNETWRSYYLWPKIYRFAAFLFSVWGYYIGISHLCYFIYNILHLCLQMVILRMYICNEMRRFHRMKLTNEIGEDQYQLKIREIFIRGVTQYTMLKV